MFRIREFGDVFADACVRDQAGQLMFISCYGRDGALQQFFASFALPPTQGGITVLNLVEVLEQEQGEPIERPAGQVQVGQASRLTKLSGRLPPENLFGNLAQAWIYDPVLLTPDRVNRRAWLILEGRFSETTREAVLDAVWALYKLLSPVPLLDRWATLLIRVTECECITLMDRHPHCQPLGEVCAVQVALPEDFPVRISEMVKNGVLGLGDEARVYLSHYPEQALKA